MCGTDVNVPLYVFADMADGEHKLMFPCDFFSLSLEGLAVVAHC